MLSQHWLHHMHMPYLRLHPKASHCAQALSLQRFPMPTCGCRPPSTLQAHLYPDSEHSSQLAYAISADLLQLQHILNILLGSAEYATRWMVQHSRPHKLPRIESKCFVAWYYCALRLLKIFSMEPPGTCNGHMAACTQCTLLSLVLSCAIHSC